MGSPWAGTLAGMQAGLMPLKTRYTQQLHEPPFNCSAVRLRDTQPLTCLLELLPMAEDLGECVILQSFYNM